MAGGVAMMDGCQRLVVLVLAGQWGDACCCLLRKPRFAADAGLQAAAAAAAAAGLGWLAVLVLQAVAPA
jgi:hypothetical protein